ncbi:FAD-dependent monooxygenase [Actinomadura luteofluorescens]|uniref:FAD-dependent monooxygenase n=1 Tax=Actinomadura luteofluorescens TaxID=46163 RepID=UPI00348D1D35
MTPTVIVVGAGPVGLMLAGELRLGGVDVAVYEQLDAPTGESRGVGFTRRAAEVFDQRGLLARVSGGEVGDEVHFGGVRIDPGILPDKHFSVRGVPQYQTEAMLEEWVRELGVPVLRGHRLTGLHQTPDEVVAVFDGPDGRTEKAARHLVGCDGGRSTVRGLTGIDFPGSEATRAMYVADVAGVDIRPRPSGERVPGGMVMAVRLERGVTRIIIHPDALPPGTVGRVTAREVAAAWRDLTGQSLRAEDLRWVSAFTDATRQAAEYRRGRVLLAGDACHIHIPAGAQGLSLGVQDAVNLGWKLAAVTGGRAPEGLLDTYHAERHPVGARVLRNTLAQSRLYLTGEEMEPMRVVLRELVTRPDAAFRLAAQISGVDVRYDMGGPGHPLLGLRLPPDWELDLPGGRRRVADLLHAARGVFIDAAGSREALDRVSGWSDRIDVVAGAWAPVPGDDRPATLEQVLVRPDGYIAWAAPGGDVRDALARWFGAARISASAAAGPADT